MQDEACIAANAMQADKHQGRDLPSTWTGLARRGWTRPFLMNMACAEGRAKATELNPGPTIVAQEKALMVVSSRSSDQRQDSGDH